MEPVLAAVQGSPPIYDFDLMTDAGRLTGHKVDDEKLVNGVAEALEKLMDRGRRPGSGSDQTSQASSEQPTPML